MKYLLDTNISIHFFRGKYHLDQKIEKEGLQNYALSEITLAELVFGAENSTDPSRNLEIVERFTSQVAILDAIPIYAREKVRLRKLGLMISDFDLLIGATAIAYDFVMVTENSKEFERIKGIKTENWIKR